MEIRRQLLGIVIGIFITISFIGPVYSFGDSTDICDLKVYDLTEIIAKVNKGGYTKSNGGYYFLD